LESKGRRNWERPLTSPQQLEKYENYGFHASNSSCKLPLPADEIREELKSTVLLRHANYDNDLLKYFEEGPSPDGNDNVIPVPNTLSFCPLMHGHRSLSNGAKRYGDSVRLPLTITSQTTSLHQ